MAQFYTLLTQVGQAKLANAVALGNTIELTHLAVGDGGGSVPTPDSDRTALINEVRRAPINRVEVDADNPNWVVVEQVMPPDVGGWTIREIGVFDSAGDLIAYGNYPETYKPTLDEGSGRTQTVRMVLQVSDTASVTLKVDPSVVLATRQYADEGDAATSQTAAQALQEHIGAQEAHDAHQISVEPIEQAPQAESVAAALTALGDFAADGCQNVAVFDAPGVHQWTVPEVLRLGLRKAHVTVVAGGGAGGRESGSAGGGGGAGGTAIALVSLEDVSEVEITIGAGGQGSSTNTSGGSGGSSSLGSSVSATGGSGGPSGGGAGAGGTGVGGDINLRGNYGFEPITDRQGNPTGGSGGASIMGGATLGRGSGNSVGALTGSGSGGTGTGASGNGGDGIVIVRW